MYQGKTSPDSVMREEQSSYRLSQRIVAPSEFQVVKQQPYCCSLKFARQRQYSISVYDSIDNSAVLIDRVPK